jgi:hypothetical protein
LQLKKSSFEEKYYALFGSTSTEIRTIQREGQNRFCLEAREGGGEREGLGSRGEKWPKQCMHI